MYASLSLLVTPQLTGRDEKLAASSKLIVPLPSSHPPRRFVSAEEGQRRLQESQWVPTPKGTAVDGREVERWKSHIWMKFR